MSETVDTKDPILYEKRIKFGGNRKGIYLVDFGLKMEKYMQIYLQ
jgi:hypothetical protein